jgi:hypothetical protein
LDSVPEGRAYRVQLRRARRLAWVVSATGCDNTKTPREPLSDARRGDLRAAVSVRLLMARLLDRFRAIGGIAAAPRSADAQGPRARTSVLFPLKGRRRRRRRRYGDLGDRLKPGGTFALSVAKLPPHGCFVSLRAVQQIGMKMTMFRISTRQVVLVCVTIVLTTLSAGSLFISASSAQELVMLELSPRTATNPVGTQHCVTATVRGLGGPVSGAPVRFTVVGTAIEAVKTTVANGNAMFCYTGRSAHRHDYRNPRHGHRPLPAQPAQLRPGGLRVQPRLRLHERRNVDPHSGCRLCRRRR